MNRIDNNAAHSGGAHRALAAKQPAPSAFLTDLPSDVVRTVGRYLAPPALASMQSTSRKIERDVRPLIRAAQISEDQAPRVATLARFQELIGNGEPTLENPRSVTELPADMRAQPLAVLGSRILALPIADRQDAVDS